MPEEKKVLVTWYNCDCPWITKFCDENHFAKALVPVSLLEPHVLPR